MKDSPETGARPRFFSLEGYRGMGKSSLALSIMHYTAERKMFLGGLMLVQCQQIKNCADLYKLILRQVVKFFDMDDEAR